MQIIAAAMIAGLTLFLLIDIWLVNFVHVKMQNPRPLPILSLIAVVVFSSNLLFSLLLPNIIARQAVQNIVAGKWQGRARNTLRPPSTIAEYLHTIQQSKMIVAFALLEGAGFLAGIAYLLEGRVFTLCIVIVVILVMLSIFPTAQKCRDWMTKRAEQIERLRK